MKGQGFYNAISRPQRSTIDTYLPLIQAHLDASAASATSRPSSSAFFTIVDYGSSEGLNSVVLFQQLFPQLRTRIGADAPIVLVHEDQKANDWNSLFKTSTREALKDEHVFVMGSATSFHEAVMPPASVDFDYSSFSFMWLPLNLPEIRPEDEAIAKLSLSPGLLPSSPYRTRFEEFGLKSFESLMALRFRELKPGAHAIFISIWFRNDERAASVDTVMRAIRQQVEKGLILESEVVRMKSASWNHTTDEQAQARCKAAGFIVDHYETGKMADLFRAEFEETGDRPAYADKVTKWYRSISEMTVATQIAPERRTAAVDAVYAAFRDIVASECQERSNYITTSLHVLALSKPQQ